MYEMINMLITLMITIYTCSKTCQLNFLIKKKNLL
jgi:hypothetical protein